MSSQLNTLDHAIMGILFRSSTGMSVGDLCRRSKTAKHKVSKSVKTLMELGFVSRRVDAGAEPLHSAVLDCLYFPPVTCVASRVFSFESSELKTLVAECDKQLLTNF